MLSLCWWGSGSDWVSHQKASSYALFHHRFAMAAYLKNCNIKSLKDVQDEGLVLKSKIHKMFKF